MIVASIRALILACVLAAVAGPPVLAQDMRASAIQRREIQARLQAQVAAERKQAADEARLRREAMLSDKKRLTAAVDELRAENQRLAATIRNKEEELSRLHRQEESLDAKLSEMDSTSRDLVVYARVGAKDLQTLRNANSVAGENREEQDFLLSLTGDDSRVPGMDDLFRLVDLVFDEIQRSGEVRKNRGAFVDRDGQSVQGEVLRIGNFIAAYRLGDEAGFLTRTRDGSRLFALSRLPSGRVQRQLKRYMDAESEDVPMDISRGAALRQLSHRLSLFEQIAKGGPIVWPILAIGVLALLIVLERTVFLLRRHLDADGFMKRIQEMAGNQSWDRCEAVCRDRPGKPVSRVLLAGLDARHMNREEMENVLQEAILKEIPGLERFLSTLGMLAAIAPLLGLLGTVTGMINTFHAITAYGTGDPRMMSGGISEALVTTMLGLSVAIPILFVHTLLSRKVEAAIGQMEEKAVAFVNLVHKTRNGYGDR